MNPLLQLDRDRIVGVLMLVDRNDPPTARDKEAVLSNAGARASRSLGIKDRILMETRPERCLPGH